MIHRLLLGFKQALGTGQAEPGTTPSPDPVFIFAVCWRTGSTLLQRIINASGQVFIWGEPGFLSEAKGMYSRLQTYLDKVENNRKKAFNPKVGNWIPIVSPAPHRATLAMKAFFEELYARETVQLGYARWGFKEVRSMAVAHITMLADIYPQARFLFLIRDPYDTYRSIKGKKFHANFKDPMQPMRIWTQNAREFLESKDLEPHCLMIRYEDLIVQNRNHRSGLDSIATYARVKVTEKMFEELNARTDPSGETVELTRDDIEAITPIVRDTAPRLGYELR